MSGSLEASPADSQPASIWGSQMHSLVQELWVPDRSPWSVSAVHPTVSAAQPQALAAPQGLAPCHTLLLGSEGQR